VQPSDGHVWLMQPEAQTTTRGSLAVSASALEIAIDIQGALEEWSHYLYLFTSNQFFSLFLIVLTGNLSS